MQRPAIQLLPTYTQLFQGLLPGIRGCCLWDADLVSTARTGSLSDTDADALLEELGWRGNHTQLEPALVASARDTCLIAIPLLRSARELFAAVCVELPQEQARALGDRPANCVAQRLKPALDCLYRELSAAAPASARAAKQAGRTEELEWLFDVSTSLQGVAGEPGVLERLLAAAVERLHCAVGAVVIPGKRLKLVCALDRQVAAPLLGTLDRTRKPLVAFAQRGGKALLVNKSRPLQQSLPPCKLLSVPVAASSGRIVGILAFFNPPQAADFSSRQVFLAKHLARQVTRLLEAQFDLMTGLYTRAALEQRCEQLGEEKPDVLRSILYIDIDQLHVVNELHGFELGDEVIVRIADLLGPPLVPANAAVGRVSGDRFAVVLEACEPRAAAQIATTLQSAASGIRIGPGEDAVEVSVSCGIAAFVTMPKGFARALAAAEIACKTAKDRGRNRIELYACEDTSMMRRHDDVIVVGQLRDAIKTERLLLYAQPIVALKNERRLNGFEVLLRMRNPDGTISPPADFISAARRYQLLPAIDRYVVRQALQIAMPFRGLLRECGASVSINVSGQSVGDESFIDYILAEVRRSGMAPGLITCEITEQTAIDSLSRTAELMQRLRRAGFRVALDDFGTGANTLAYLKTLPASRIKIDGSFVRDLPDNPRSEAMVRAILSLARQFGMETVAEYVESEPLARRLERLGVDYGQGYAFGRPAPFEQMLRDLRSAESQRLRAQWLREA